MIKPIIKTHYLNAISISVYFNSKEKCLSLQCSAGDTRFIPEECSKPFKTVCENMGNFAIIESLILLSIICIDKLKMAWTHWVIVIIIWKRFKYSIFIFFLKNYQIINIQVLGVYQWNIVNTQSHLLIYWGISIWVTHILYVHVYQANFRLFG